MAFLSLYEATEGGPVERLVHLGCIKLDDERSIRMMGQEARFARTSVPKGAANCSESLHGLPFAFIVERAPRPLSPDLCELGPAPFPPPKLEEGRHVRLTE